MNTYGLHAINNRTFNLMPYEAKEYPKQARDALVTGFRINNLVLNILGYIPGVSLISGSFRILEGIALYAITLVYGDRNAKAGPIIGHFYDEALHTAIAQIVRGIFEAFVPFGWVVNASLDGLATVYNFVIGPCFDQGASDLPYEDRYHEPYPDPEYPVPLNILMNIV